MDYSQSLDKERDLIVNTLDTLEKIIGNDFHGYRSEVWNIITDVIQQTKDSEKELNISVQTPSIGPVKQSVNKEKYIQGLNNLARAKNPLVEFTEDINAMRMEALEQKEKSISEAYNIFFELIN